MNIAHYTSIKVLHKIIDNMTLRLSKITKTNDIFETEFEKCLIMNTPPSSNLNEGKEALTIAHQKKIQKLVEDQKKHIRILCFSHSNNYKDHLDCANNHFLWTYYANRKNGVYSGCSIIFDKEILIQNLEKEGIKVVYSGPVSYYQENLFPKNLKIRDLTPEFIFSRKTNIWNCEKEYRIIFDLKNSRNNYDLRKSLFINIKDSLKAVVLPIKDHKSFKKDHSNTYKILKKNNINIYGRMFSASNFKHFFITPESYIAPIIERKKLFLLSQ